MTHAPTLEKIDLAGTPRQIGEAFGEACRAETRELYERRLETAIHYAKTLSNRHYAPDEVLALARRCLPFAETYDPIGHEEFLGIARGADMQPEELLLMQGQTDYRDVLAFGDVNAPVPADSEGCSSFIIAPDRAADGHALAGQTWDLSTNNEPYVRLVHRKPDEGPETLSLTLTGCLTLIGLNSEGLAVGTTNLHTTDGRPGLHYLNLIHRAIRCRTIEDAAPCFIDAPRAGAHYYFLADASGKGLGLECSATRHESANIQHGIYVHCNHALAESIRDIEAPFTRDSTEYRQDRLAELLEAHPDPINVDDVRQALSDRAGGERCICRYNTTAMDVSTNATVIMSPQTGELHACRAQPDRGAWRTCKL